jgi:hypothetical protein
MDNQKKEKIKELFSDKVPAWPGIITWAKVKTVLLPNVSQIPDDYQLSNLLLQTHVASLSAFQKSLNIATLGKKKVSTNTQNQIVGSNITVSRHSAWTAELPVYEISGLPDLTVTITGEPEREVAGGAELYNGERKTLFDKVIDETCKTEREPAMELLVELYGYAKDVDDKESADLIASQCGFDALTSLAIVLQPHKNQGERYLSDEFLKKFTETVYGADNSFKNAPIYGTCPNVADKYQSIMESISNPCLCDTIVNFAELVRQKNIVEKLKAFYDRDCPEIKSVKRRQAPRMLKYAEAELRVLAALLYDGNEPTATDLKALYSKCNLDMPYICDNVSAVSSSLQFYMSTAFLIARSDALMFLPLTSGDSLGDIGDSDSVISVDRDFCESRRDRRKHSQCAINHFISRFRRP